LVRLAINLGFSIGPAIGGLIAATKGYSWLFWVDGLTCIAAAMLFRLFLTQKEEVLTPGSTETIAPAGNGSPFKDQKFLIFALLTMISGTVFMQLFSILPVFYKQDFAMNEGQIGMLLAMNGLLIALLEMPIIYTMERRVLRKLSAIGWGAMLIGASFFMLELAVFWKGILVLSMVVITFGEIFMMPFSNVFAIDRAPVATRGQYMAVYSSTWSVAHIIAPVLGMQIASAWGFSTLWYVLAGLCVLAFMGYKILEKQLSRQPSSVLQQPVPEPVAEV